MSLSDVPGMFPAKCEEGQEFAHLILNERLKRWRSAKTFWRDKKEILKISYNRYSVVESGSIRPSLNLALNIVEALEIDESTAIHAFVRDLMPTPQLKSHFIDLQSAQNIASFRALSITEEQSKLFKKSPVANEMASYISIHSDRGVSIKEIAEKFSMKIEYVKDVVHSLIHAEIVSKSGKNLYTIPNGAWINTPDLSEFRESRVRSFSLTIDSHFSSDYLEQVTIEQTTFRILSNRQINMIRSIARSLARWISSLPDEKGKPYRFFCGGNLCQFGNNRKSFVPTNRRVIDDR